MIGDRDLGILQEMNGSATLRRLVWTVASENGFKKYFLDGGMSVEDDHMPFVRAGVNAIDIIDFEYGGPSNPFWHNEKDTIDKLSAHSLQVVGDVLIAALRRLERQ